MVDVEEVDLTCPYCGQGITMLIDRSVEKQRYIEDCEVCCRPIIVDYTISDEEEVFVQVRGEDE